MEQSCSERATIHQNPHTKKTFLLTPERRQVAVHFDVRLSVFSCTSAAASAAVDATTGRQSKPYCTTDRQGTASVSKSLSVEVSFSLSAAAVHHTSGLL